MVATGKTKFIAKYESRWLWGIIKGTTFVFIHFARRAILIAAVLAAAGILLGFLSPWIDAADSLGHFRFHATAVLLLLSAALAWQRYWRRAALGLVVSAIGMAGMVPALPVWWKAEAPAAATGINMVQFNLSFRNSTPQAVADYIRAADADIVTLQEVTNKTARVMEILAKDYPAQVRCRYVRVGAVAVLSRLPMAAGEAKGCVDGQGMTWIRVMVGGQKLTVASLHLHWPWPFKQHRQIGNLEKYLRNIPRPVLLAGDFNAAPWSHAVQRVAMAADASVAPGLRFSFDIELNDWAPPLPIPIDHILLPGDITPLDVRLGPELGSDHRPVIAHLALSTKMSGKLAHN